MKKLMTLGILMFSMLPLIAQDASESIFRQSGKIYVVVAILGIIMIGIFLFLVRLDKKIKKLEDKIK